VNDRINIKGGHSAVETLFCEPACMPPALNRFSRRSAINRK
jgi:hypothetical protein